MTITYRAIKGAPLTAAELDGNFEDLDGRIVDLVDNPPTPVGIAAINVAGTMFTVELDDATVFGPFAIPTQTQIPPTVATVTGTTRTLAMADAQSYLRCTNPVGCAITVPPHAAVPFPIGTEVHFRAAVYGAMSFLEGDTSVAIYGVDGFEHATDTIGAVCTLKKISMNEWDLFGNLAVGAGSL